MRPKQIWAIGGGKGGVGKSFVSGNLGILLAQRGYKVVLADLDLGGANLHTWLGINSPDRGLSEFVGREIDKIEELLVPTQVPGLSLISGARDGVEIANLKHSQKRRFLNAMKRLNADYIVMDLGAGTAYNTIDFFLLADIQLLVVIPEPTSIENAYRFIKNSFYRQLRHNSADFGLKPTMEQLLKIDNVYGIKTPKELISHLKQSGGSATVFIEEQLEIFQPKMILNQVRSESDIRIGTAMEAACMKYFGLTLKLMGCIDRDEEVWQSVLRRKPLSVEKPDGVSVKRLKTICTDILADGSKWPEKKSLLSSSSL